MQPSHPSLSFINAGLESTWKAFDAVYSALPPAAWSRKFGKNWTYADQPYHLAYFDRFHADAVARGSEVPPQEQVTFSTMSQLNGWNASQFARRPQSQTVEQTLSQMQESRKALRKLVAGMNESDLGRKAWSSLLGGWVPAWAIFQAVIIHNVGEYQKLWLRSGGTGPTLPPEVIHERLGLMMKFLSLSLNQKAAAQAHFTAVWNFDGPGGGAWTFRVNEGKCTLSEEQAGGADLVVSMKPETLQKLIAKMESPVWLMMSGQMKVSHLSKMGTFGKLFPEPKPDQVLITGPEAFLA